MSDVRRSEIQPEADKYPGQQADRDPLTGLPGVRLKKICITNRHLLAAEGLAEEETVRLLVRRIEEICRFHTADALILREKDLPDEAYLKLAEKVIPVCQKEGMPLILHHFIGIAGELHFPAIHLSMPEFLELSKLPGSSANPLRDSGFNHAGMGSAHGEFRTTGVSTHTVEEAVLAEERGAAYITASHIFPTQCKPGLPPRGLDYLREVCQAVRIPVYALGGIHPDRIDVCMEAGAAGVCMMSEFMQR